MVHNPIHELPVDEAWALLASSDVGRIALSVGGQPDIFPINYFAGDGRVLMRTAEGTKLAELAVNGKVAFEADAYNDDGGWSVVVKGSARILTTLAEIAKADEAPLRPIAMATTPRRTRVMPQRVRCRPSPSSSALPAARRRTSPASPSPAMVVVARMPVTDWASSHPLCHVGWSPEVRM